jgi:tetratricopeptide (TPR) repeat protein
MKLRFFLPWRGVACSSQETSKARKFTNGALWLWALQATPLQNPRVCALALTILAVSSVHADLLDDAIEAAQNGIPEVGITKAQQFLTSHPEAARAETARLLLARCLISTNKPQQARDVLDGVNESEATFLRAESARRSKRWKQAETLFSELLHAPGEFAKEARLGLADCQRALSQLDVALDTLSPELTDSDNGVRTRALLLAAEIALAQPDVPKAEGFLGRLEAVTPRVQLEKLCLAGQVELKKGNLSTANDIFQKILAEPTDRTSRVVTLAHLGLVRILIQNHDLEEAESKLEKLISDQPRTPALSEMFETLFEVYVAQGGSATPDFAKWAADSSDQAGPDRPVYALYYLARLQLQQGLKSQAEQSCRELLQRFPTHQMATETALLLSCQELDGGEVEDAVKRLEGLSERAIRLPGAQRFRVLDLLAESYYRQGNLRAARDIFLNLSNGSDFEPEKTLFNAALCSLQIGDRDGFAQALARLQKQREGLNVVGDLLFAKGLLEARTGQSSADETLHMFSKEYRTHPKAPEAFLVQAELRLTEQPPDVAAAKQALQQAGNNPNLQERTDRLKIFVDAADPAQSGRAVEMLAQEYLQKYPNSSNRPEIRLKLGEVYFRQSDFPNAQTQFELVREEDPDSPLVETALFLAGEAARKSLNPSSIDRAIVLFEDVYKRSGPLKFQARLEQALTMRQIKRDREAIVLLDDLLGQNPPPEIRHEALDNKGDAQFTLAAANAGLYEDAVKTFETLAALDHVPEDWKQRALYQKGKCLEKLSRQDDALSTYYDVLAVDGGKGDQLWFFRAGFDAGQILEERRSWGSAAAIYEKLANTRGARSEEAKNRLTRLRLEHFLWPD